MAQTHAPSFVTDFADAAYLLLHGELPTKVCSLVPVGQLLRY
jgi:hypothetical protein